ncbi:MAG: YciI family protein [Gemmatimonadales bacterium]
MTESHRTYLGRLHSEGVLLVSGPLDPRFGGALILRVCDEGALAALDRIRDADPYVQAGVAQYELLPWAPGLGKEKLDTF